MSTRREFLSQTAATGLVAASSIQAAQGAGDKPKHTGPLRLAIVGTGQISHRYFKQAAVGNRAQFVATCARTVDEARERANQYGVKAWFDDYTAMYDKVKPDAVVVCTPTVVHAGPTIAALERGIHVLCEKPMAMTLEECQAMVAASKKSGAVLLSLPFDATVHFYKVLEYLNEETLGAFTGAEAQLLFPGPGRDNWYYDRKVAGGGVGLDTLVYGVSRLIALLGPARSVTAFANTLIPHRIVADGKRVESDVEDNMTIAIEWPSGQQAVVRGLWGASIGRLDTTIYGRHGTLWLGVFSNELVVHSPKRVIEAAEPITWNGQKNCYRIPVKLPPDGTEGLINHFADCIEGRAQPTCGGEQTLHVHEILFKAYEAARTGRTQQLVTTFTPWHQVNPSFYDTRSRFI